MIKLPNKINPKNHYHHEFEGGHVDIAYIESTDFDFIYQDLLLRKSGYLSYQDMLERNRILEREALGRKMVEFERASNQASREAFAQTCIKAINIDGVDYDPVEIAEDLASEENAISINEWLTISKTHIFYLAKLEQEASEQIKK